MTQFEKIIDSYAQFFQLVKFWFTILKLVEFFE